ncbi:MAG: uroporphyrinogen decarboxylase [Phycisphaerales bacterium]|nr:MAG: uroporphyrinogen decarboxylase [Phycisphaerales bacterium]
MSTTLIANDLILRAARRQRTERTGVWLMRQAGRFDPAYLALREEAGLPLEQLFRHPELAASITMLPRRFGVDALILFQDILTPLDPMGVTCVFRPGPQFDKPVRSEADVRQLKMYEPGEELPFVPESIRLVQRELDGAIPLLGFAGAPFTLAAFLIEGRSPGRCLDHTRVLMKSDPAALHRLLEKLATLTASYLSLQIDTGVDGVQLFESVADLLSDAEYQEFAHPYQAAVLQLLGDRVPRILFVKERACLGLMVETGADVLSVGRCVDLAKAKSLYGDRVALQGNVDNRLLQDGSPDEVEEAVRSCIAAGRHEGHILNLNHGLLKDTPVENVCRLIETCRTTTLHDANDAGGER